MAVETTLDLKGILFEAYGGFADKRYKNLERDAPFIVDDRGDGDYDARGQLFLWFCLMFLTVETAERVVLMMRGGVPESDAIHAWFDTNEAVRTNAGIELRITPETLKRLDELADLFDQVIKRRYDVKAYKFVVPRASASLRQLRGVLFGAWA